MDKADIMDLLDGLEAEQKETEEDGGHERLAEDLDVPEMLPTD